MFRLNSFNKRAPKWTWNTLRVTEREESVWGRHDKLAPAPSPGGGTNLSPVRFLIGRFASTSSAQVPVFVKTSGADVLSPVYEKQRIDYWSWKKGLMNLARVPKGAILSAGIIHRTCHRMTRE